VGFCAVAAPGGEHRQVAPRYVPVDSLLEAAIGPPIRCAARPGGSHATSEPVVKSQESARIRLNSNMRFGLCSLNDFSKSASNVELLGLLLQRSRGETALRGSIQSVGTPARSARAEQSAQLVPSLETQFSIDLTPVPSIETARG
jgi:hypothetical protein